MKILGIDPGTAVTGYGVVESISNKYNLVQYGTIKTSAKDPLPIRLHQLFTGLKEVIQQYQPDAVSIESIFYSENVKTALILGHTRGALITASVEMGLNVDEYSPREVKRSVVGNGNASKEQVQYMIKMLLGLKEIPKPNDAADGCAIAICHLNQLKQKQRYKSAGL